MDRFTLMRMLLQRAMKDIRLSASQISLFSALCHVWMANGCENPFNVSRSQLMQLARIKSKATYHKFIRVLERGGYILYSPSYHPKNGTAISLLQEEGKKKKELH